MEMGGSIVWSDVITDIITKTKGSQPSYYRAEQICKNSSYFVVTLQKLI
jgi:hypothetical protein